MASLFLMYYLIVSDVDSRSLARNSTKHFERLKSVFKKKLKPYLSIGTPGLN